METYETRRPWLEAIRPHRHRGDVVAAGAVVLTAAVLLINVRMDGPWRNGVFLVLDALACAFLLAMALLSEREGPAPRAYQTALLVSALALLLTALIRLAHVFGVDGILGSAGALTWVGATFTLTASYLAVRFNSGVCMLAAALGAGATAVAAVQWIFEPQNGTATARYVLLLTIVAFTLASVSLRDTNRRRAVALVNAAGIAAIALALTFAFALLFGSIVDVDRAAFGWELLLFAVGCGLLAYAAVDDERGPGYLGGIVLLAFAVIAGLPDRHGATLIGWPVFLLLASGAFLVTGLRPRTELPPSPDADAPQAPTTPISPVEPRQ